MRQFWLGCILLSTVLNSAAASLGRQSGAAVIGRPLDVRMQLLLGPQETLDALCLSAEVTYGDAPVPGSAVVVTPQRSTPDAQLTVRVQAARPVNEPFVSVNLRAGCSAPFARQYVFLADPAADEARPSQAPLPAPAPPSAPPQVAVPAPGAGEIEARSPSAEERVSQAGTPPTARLRVAPSARQAAAGTPAAATPAAAAPRSVVRRPPAAVAPPAPAPRLQLEPLDLDLSIERSPKLKLSPSMLSEPTGAEETRAAAARLWLALNASPEDILRDTQKLAVLEAEIQGLRAEEQKNAARVAELGAAADRARYLNGLVFLLGALLLLALAGLVWLWRRQKSLSDQASTAWWSEASQAEMAGTGPTHRPVDKKPAGTAEFDVDLEVDSGYGEPLVGGGAKSPAAAADKKGVAEVAAKDRKEFSSSALGGSRSVATEELFDIQQQADFFVSLGEVDQAIEVLLNHLAESFEPSPLAYLDLFKLYHRQNRRDDYERLRTEFNELFNAGAPPFDQYSDQSRSLESYETAFTRIQALWPEPRVLDVIEQSIFRDFGDSDSEVFDLEAYRELLLLHAIAKDLVKREAENPPTSFRHTKVQPLKAMGQAGDTDDSPSVQDGLNGRNTVPMEINPPVSANLGLDIDLSEFDAYAEFEASLPEISAPVEPTAKSSGGVNRKASGTSSLIDFDLLDFSRPDDPNASSGQGGNR